MHDTFIAQVFFTWFCTLYCISFTYAALHCGWYLGDCAPPSFLGGLCFCFCQQLLWVLSRTKTTVHLREHTQKKKKDYFIVSLNGLLFFKRKREREHKEKRQAVLFVRQHAFTSETTTQRSLSLFMSLPFSFLFTFFSRWVCTRGTFVFHVFLFCFGLFFFFCLFFTRTTVFVTKRQTHL